MHVVRQLWHRRSLIGRFVIGMGAFLLAAWRFVALGGIAAGLDPTVLVLLGVAALMIVIPWDKVESFKAGGLELTLAKPAVKAAVEKFNVAKVRSHWRNESGNVLAARGRTLEPPPEVVKFAGKDHEFRLDGGIERIKIREKDLMDELRSMEEQLPAAAGARVLWIDDLPDATQPERAILRSLGVHITTALDGYQARDALKRDNDFDLVVTDVFHARFTDGLGRDDWPQDHHHASEKGIEGASFILHHVRKQPDDHTRSLPVIYYSAITPSLLHAITDATRAHGTSAYYARTPHELISRVIRTAALVQQGILRPEEEIYTGVLVRGTNGAHAAPEAVTK